MNKYDNLVASTLLQLRKSGKNNKIQEFIDEMENCHSFEQLKKLSEEYLKNGKDNNDTTENTNA